MGSGTLCRAAAPSCHANCSIATLLLQTTMFLLEVHTPCSMDNCTIRHMLVIHGSPGRLGFAQSGTGLSVCLSVERKHPAPGVLETRRTCDLRGSVFAPGRQPDRQHPSTPTLLQKGSDMIPLDGLRSGSSTHTYIHTYIHTYVHAYIHTCIHTYMHTYVHAYLHTHTHECTVITMRRTETLEGMGESGQ
jgi:hypothetical protein